MKLFVGNILLCSNWESVTGNIYTAGLGYKRNRRGRNGGGGGGGGAITQRAGEKREMEKRGHRRREN